MACQLILTEKLGDMCVRDFKIQELRKRNINFDYIERIYNKHVN